MVVTLTRVTSERAVGMRCEQSSSELAVHDVSFSTGS